MAERNRIVEPFKSLDELYYNLDKLVAWPEVEPLRECADFVFLGSQIHDTNKRLSKLNRDNQPKTLVCHDMMGGYLEDRFIDGTNTHYAYLFYQWNYIDTFIYFSHHLITIPPYGWVTVAHKHGVKILGTVITEHKKGEVVCEKILQSQSTVHEFVNALIRIAKFYNFDGWLLNIENKISNVTMLRYLVKYLTEQIHQEIEGSEVIWYDSVTDTGKLLWQNKLSEANEQFFEVCDGIFLNYNWTKEGLQQSFEKARIVNRVKDVYVGLDVWGRSCPGGGGFNSAYALDIIRKVGLSVAIFAQGWTYQFFGSNTFHAVERIFWAQLISMLFVHVPVYENEIFVSSFGRGIGIKEFRCGKLSKESPFFDLSKQYIQPCLPYWHSRFESGFSVNQNDVKANTTKKERIYETTKEVMKITGKTVTFETKVAFLTSKNNFDHSQDFSYNGGESLKFIINDIRVYHRLFLIQIDSHSEVQGIIIFRPDDTDVRSRRINPILVLGNHSGKRIITASRTIHLSSGWKKSIYYTDWRSFYEIGVAFSTAGICYLGELILEKRDFYSENKTTCSDESFAIRK